MADPFHITSTELAAQHNFSRSLSLVPKSDVGLPQCTLSTAVLKILSKYENKLMAILVLEYQSNFSFIQLLNHWISMKGGLIHAICLYCFRSWGWNKT